MGKERVEEEKGDAECHVLGGGAVAVLHRVGIAGFIGR